MLPCIVCKNETDKILGSRTDSPFGFCLKCEADAKAVEDKLGRLWDLDVRETFLSETESGNDIDLHCQCYYVNGIGTLEIGIGDDCKSEEFECELNEFLEIVREKIEESRNEVSEMIDAESEV